MRGKMIEAVAGVNHPMLHCRDGDVAGIRRQQVVWIGEGV